MVRVVKEYLNQSNRLESKQAYYYIGDYYNQLDEDTPLETYEDGGFTLKYEEDEVNLLHTLFVYYKYQPRKGSDGTIPEERRILIEATTMAEVLRNSM